MTKDEVDVVSFVNNNVSYFENGIPQIGIAINGKTFLYEQSFIEFINKAYNTNEGE